MKPHRPITILHVNDKLSMDGVNPSSVAILQKEWIAHFNKAYFKFCACTLQKKDPGGEYLQDHNINVHYSHFGKYSYRNVGAIIRLVDRESVDILHLHGYRSGNFGRIAARTKKIFNIVHEHAVLPVLPHQYVADFLLRNYIDSAIAVSEAVKQFMVRGRCLPSSMIYVIPNGIRIEEFKRLDPKLIREKRVDLSIPEGVNIVGSVTRLRKEKGNEYLIKAIPYILRKHPNTLFLIVGDGPLRSKLETLASDLNVLQNVRFIGFRNDVNEILPLFAVNVIPSLSEGFGLSLVEAMSAGNAIVATEVGGMKEIAVSGITALLIKPKDPVDLSRKVIFFLENPVTAAKFSKKAQSESLKYRIESNTNSIRNLYMKIAGEKRF